MRQPRPGAVALETALVLPVMFVLLFTIIVGGMAAFRYQQVACQAREAARWASVRGSDWADETGKTSPTKRDIFRRAVAPHAVGMSHEAISFEVRWIDQNTGATLDWDESPKCPRSVTAAEAIVANSVRVTVTYNWSPQILWFRPMQLRSMSEMPMAF